MKQLFSFLLFVLLNTLALAQVPQGLNYQGVARNSQGTPLASQAIKLRFSLRSGSANGTVVYSETRSTTTNNFGLFSIVAGSAGAQTVTGDFKTINWAGGSKFLQVEMDPAGGNSFTTIGTTELQSVPFALHSKKASELVFPQHVAITYDNELLKLANQSTNPASSAASFSSNGEYATVSAKNNNIGAGIHGESSDGVGVRGQSQHSHGIYGTSATEYGVVGTGDGTGGVMGLSNTGYGVHGKSNSGYGVLGEGHVMGVRGVSTNGYGVVGKSTSYTGVFGNSESGNGVSGVSNKGNGIVGSSNDGYGVYGSSNMVGVQGISAKGYGVVGKSTALTGVLGSSESSTGVFGTSNTGTGVRAESTSGYALDVSGKLRISGGDTGPGAGKVLTSDVTGNATWQSLPPVPKVVKSGFSARGIATNGLENIPHAKWYKVHFRVQDYDAGNDYTLFNQGTATKPSSTFIAPVAGFYHFDARTLIADGGLSYSLKQATIRLLVRKGNGTVMVIQENRNQSSSGIDADLLINTSISLNVGDQVWVEVIVYTSNKSNPTFGNAYYEDLYHHSFSGFLVFAD